MSSYFALWFFFMEKAAELLLTDMSGISEIANSVGYESSKFAKAFKIEFGISPAEYRRERAVLLIEFDRYEHNISGTLLYNVI